MGGALSRLEWEGLKCKAASELIVVVDVMDEREGGVQ